MVTVFCTIAALLVLWLLDWLVAKVISPLRGTGSGMGYELVVEEDDSGMQVVRREGVWRRRTWWSWMRGKSETGSGVKKVVGNDAVRESRSWWFGVRRKIQGGEWRAAE